MSLNSSMGKLYKERAAILENKKRQRLEKPVEDVIDFSLQPTKTFDEIYGCEAASAEVISIVNHFLRPVVGQLEESNWPTLICGSQGLGKTSLVEAAATHGGLRMIPIQLKKLVGNTRHEFKENLEQLTRFCISTQPAIVLVDDLDRLGDKEELKHILQESIHRLIEPENKLLVFCTTSSTLEDAPDIDFSSVIYLKRPDSIARFNILKAIKKEYSNLASLSDDNLGSLAMSTPSFSAPALKKMLLLAERKSDGCPTLENCKQAVELVKQSFKRGTHLIGQKPSITWRDIGGMSEVRQAFTDILRQTRRGGLNCKFAGIALYGPPGCGKTMVAQAMANEANFNFISIKPAELVNKFLGETEKNIRRVFHDAREHEPCMIYFDEFDGLCGTRGNKDNVTSAIQTLLAEMDGFVDRGKSIILASTNRLEDIDPAMKRPGRLSKHIYVGPPDERARFEILNVIVSRPSVSLAPDVELKDWARRTPNFTGAELDFLVSEAESRAMRETNFNDESTYDESVVLNQEHFEYAINKIRSTNRELRKKTIRIEDSKD